MAFCCWKWFMHFGSRCNLTSAARSGIRRTPLLGRCCYHRTSGTCFLNPEMRGFLEENTEVSSSGHLTPEIQLRLLTPRCRFWEEKADLWPYGDPFWAIYWPGGQALSRYILDNPHVVRKGSVLDLGSGCGATAIAAVMSGASQVLANDIDPSKALFSKFCARPFLKHIRWVEKNATAGTLFLYPDEKEFRLASLTLAIAPSTLAQNQAQYLHPSSCLFYFKVSCVTLGKSLHLCSVSIPMGIILNGDVAGMAMVLNCELNNVTPFPVITKNIIDTELDNWDLIVLGDMFYDDQLANSLHRWLRKCIKTHGTEVLIGDPGRPQFLSHNIQSQLHKVVEYSLPESTRQENNGYSSSTVWRYQP